MILTFASLFLVSSGCAPEAGSDLASDRSPPAPLMPLSVAGAGLAGGTVRVELSEAPAGARVSLLLGSNDEGGTCPAILGGACLGVSSPGGVRAVGSGVVDVQGRWAVDLQIPARAPDGLWHLQAAVQAAPALLSEVATLRIGPDCVDAWEPNDDLTAAAAAPGTWSASVCGRDEDWYQLELPAEGLLNVALLGDPADGDVDVELVDATGAVLDGSYRVDGTESLEHLNLSGAPGTLWLHAWGMSDPQGDGVAYDTTVEITLHAPCADDAAEGDDTVAAAHPLAGGLPAIACPGDADWYSAPVRAGELLHVEALSDPAEGHVVVNLYDPQGVLLRGGYGPTAEIVADRDMTIGVEVVLEADDAAGGGAPYALDWRVQAVTACGPDALEPDDAPEVAAPVGPGIWTDLSVCSGHDWFAVDMEAGGTLEVWLRYDPDDGQLASQLFDPTGHMVVFTMMADGLIVLHTESTLPGPYLVHVADSYDQPAPTVGGVAYTMTIVTEAP